MSGYALEKQKGNLCKEGISVVKKSKHVDHPCQNNLKKEWLD